VKVLVLALTTLASISAPAEAKPRVGYANVARDGAAGQGAIANVRARVAAKADYEELEPTRRETLETPAAAGSDDAMELGRARALCEQAREATLSFEYDSALAMLGQAEHILKGVAPSAATTQALVELNLRTGVVHAERGDRARAAEAFRLVHQLDASRTQLDPAAFRPQVVQLYAQALAAPTQAAGLTVRTDPPGALVSIDGRQLGVTPLTAPNLTAGDHYVSFTIDGYEPRTEKPRLAAGQTSNLGSLLLSKLVPEQRARAVRAGLLRDGTTEADWRRAAAALADAAEVDVLVLVRENGAAVYDVKTARLGAWVALAQVTLPAVASGSIAAAAPGEVALRLDQGRPPVDDPKPKKWYRTWWGMSLIASAVVVGAGTVLLLTGPQPDSTAVLDFTGDDGQ
jgi:hypothetical protein